jgi:hypothetical protein
MIQDIGNLKGPAELRKFRLLMNIQRAAAAAYSNGFSREDLQAICGAAYGDWYEVQEEKVKDEFDVSRMNFPHN